MKRYDLQPFAVLTPIAEVSPAATIWRSDYPVSMGAEGGEEVAGGNGRVARAPGVALGNTGASSWASLDHEVGSFVGAAGGRIVA